MTTYIALLRAINLAGINKVGMADLRAMFAALGYEDVRTLLQSGNVLFAGGPGLAPGEIEAQLEHETAARLGVTTDYLVRDAAEWAALVAANPFPDVARDEPGRLLAMPLKAEPGRERVEALRATIRGPETVEAAGRCLYIHYQEGVGRSKLTTALIERHLATRGTARNWNTVLKIAAGC